MILCVIFTLFVGGVSAEDVTSDVDNAVLDVLKNLPVKYRDVFLLKYSGNMENGEIAQLLGITEETVRKRISRGKIMVQEALDKMEEM